ncbi:MAG: alpha/beta hydrolase [Acidobacteria bacterium]|jgi:acetyl esterase/lipase|nr:alpha/beta hydrolase [Acidobacteriota bacterium]
MPSLQAQFFNRAVSLLVKRQSWGRDELAVARRARRIFGSPKLIRWFYTLGLRVQSVDEKGVRGEWIETKQPEQAVILYIHGGGFVSCRPATHRPITAALARLTGFRVFALDYRLAPEHRFPSALDDAFAAYRWLLDKNISASKISLAGDSAGGNLVLGLLLRLRDSELPFPASAVCFSPWSDLAGTGDSVRTNADLCAMFYPENIAEFAAAYLGETSKDFPLASPVYGDFKNLPPILFHVGSTEILLDDSRCIHEKIQASGGRSELEIYDDIFHCWQMAGGLVPEAHDSLSKAAEFIRRHVLHG